MAVLTYRDFLTPEDLKAVETDAYDVEAGKAGYQQYLDDQQKYREYLANNAAPKEEMPWWQQFINNSFAFSTEEDC